MKMLEEILMTPKDEARVAEAFQRAGQVKRQETYHEAANRFRNVANAIRNLRTQVGMENCLHPLYVRLEVMEEIYSHEEGWHENKGGR